MGFKAFAHLAKGLRLQLTDAFLGQTQFLPKAFKGARLFDQATLCDDIPLPVGQAIHRLAQPATHQRAIVGIDHISLGAGGFILQRIDPFAAFLIARLRRVEREVGAGKPPLHHLDIGQRHADQLGHAQAHLRAIERDATGIRLALDLSLNAAQVEEQRLLRRGRAGAHHRPVAHHKFLDRGLDPPHRIGRKTHPAIGVELVGSLHQAKARLLDQIAHRCAVAAELGGHRDRQPHIGHHQTVQRGLVAVIAPGAGQICLGLGIQKLRAHRLARQAFIGHSFECHGQSPGVSQPTIGVLSANTMRNGGGDVLYFRMILTKKCSDEMQVSAAAPWPHLVNLSSTMSR